MSDVSTFNSTSTRVMMMSEGSVGGTRRGHETTRGSTAVPRAAAAFVSSAADDENESEDDAFADYNESMEDFAFGAVARVYGDSGLKALRAARVAVVGLGGVGSYAVEVGGEPMTGLPTPPPRPVSSRHKIKKKAFRKENLGAMRC